MSDRARLKHELALADAELESAKLERDEACDRFKLAVYRVQNAERAVKEAQAMRRATALANAKRKP